MFIYSVHASKVKLVLLLVLCVGIFGALMFLYPGDGGYAGDRLTEVMNKDPKSFQNIKTGEDCVRFLESYGWTVDAQPYQIAQVKIPSEFDAVYDKYNQIQKGEGLDLTKYRGKSVKRYTYVITNYEYEGTVYANLLVYQDEIIGGDVCSANVKGFMHGWTKGNNAFPS